MFISFHNRTHMWNINTPPKDSGPPRFPLHTWGSTGTCLNVFTWTSPHKEPHPPSPGPAGGKYYQQWSPFRLSNHRTRTRIPNAILFIHPNDAWHKNANSLTGTPRLTIICPHRPGGWPSIERPSYYRPQRSWAKVIFSETCVKDSVHRGGVCLVLGGCLQIFRGEGVCQIFGGCLSAFSEGGLQFFGGSPNFRGGSPNFRRYG